MKKSTLASIAVVLAFYCVGCAFIKDVGPSVLLGVGRVVINERLSSDTTGRAPDSFDLSSFPFSPAPGNNVQFRLRTNVEGPYSWDFGGGHTITTDSRIYNKSFSQAGEYTVTVTGGTINHPRTASDKVTVEER